MVGEEYESSTVTLQGFVSMAMSEPAVIGLEVDDDDVAVAPKDCCSHRDAFVSGVRSFRKMSMSGTHDSIVLVLFLRCEL